MARITHHIISENQLLDDWLYSIELSPVKFDELIQFGAIYLDKTRINEKPKQVFKDQYLRVHHQPKRFKIGKWTIIHEDSEIVVVDKPGGLPSHPSLDNRIENMKHQLELRLKHEFFLPHRLDTVTSGLMIFCKNKESLKKISKQIEAREISKYYTALTHKPVPTGLARHFMLNSNRAPKELSDREVSDSKPCELSVLKSNQIKPGIFLNEIKLITGRTHQIRAQLSKMGSPIIGDIQYSEGQEAKSGDFDLPIALAASRIELSDLNIELENVYDRLTSQGIQI